jgi:hypothetical protein
VYHCPKEILWKKCYATKQFRELFETSCGCGHILCPVFYVNHDFSEIRLSLLLQMNYSNCKTKLWYVGF